MKRFRLVNLHASIVSLGGFYLVFTNTKLMAKAHLLELIICCLITGYMWLFLVPTATFIIFLIYHIV